jgi:hypothetical protein
MFACIANQTLEAYFDGRIDVDVEVAESTGK